MLKQLELITHLNKSKSLSNFNHKTASIDDVLITIELKNILQKELLDFYNKQVNKMCYWIINLNMVVDFNQIKAKIFLELI